MKQPFQFQLRGEEWYKLYYCYWVPTLLLTLLNLIRKAPTAGDPMAVLGHVGMSVAIGFLHMLVSSYFLIPFLKTWFPRLSVGGKSPVFGGDTTDYLVLNVVGFLLTLVTVGIYAPWWAKRVLEYCAKETTFDGAPGRFNGKAGGLLAAMVLWLLVVIAVLIVVAIVIIATGTSSKDTISVAMFFWVLVLLTPAFYLIYHWMVDFSWNELAVRWDTVFWPSVGFLAGQLALSLVTLGVYLPAAFLRSFRYFAGKTVAERAGVTVVRFGFEGNLVRGFGLFWGQILLTVITLGFYYPWAFGKVAGWMAENTYSLETAPAVQPEFSI